MGRFKVETQALFLLLQSLPDAELPALIQRDQLSMQTIQSLKEYSATFYFSEPAKALEIAHQSFQLSLHLPVPAPALGRWTLANALLHNSQLTAANALFEQARSDYLTLGYALDAARMGIGHVAVLAYTGQAQAGIALANEIKPLLEHAAATNPQDQRRLGSLLMNMGILYDLHGHYEESLVIYEQQMAIAHSLQDDLLLAQSCHNQAYALVQVGAFTEAIAQYTQAETLFQQHHATAELLRLYINLGSVFALLERYGDAAAVQAKAEQLLIATDGMDQLRHRLSLLRALFHLQSHRPVDAALLQALEQAQQAFAQHGPLVEEGLAHILLGRSHMASGDLATARQHFAQARHLGEQQADRTLAYRALHGLAQLDHLQQHHAQAITLYGTALQQIESIRHELQIESYRAAFLTDKLQVYHDLAAIHLEQGQLTRAFDVVERAKSRLVTEKLTARLNTEVNQATQVADPQTQALAQQLSSHLQQLDSLYQQIDTAQKQADPNTLEPLYGDTGTTLQHLEQGVQSLLNQIQRRQQLFSPLATGQTVSLAQIQSTLDNAIFLQYHQLGEHFAVFVLDRAGIQSHVRLAKVSDVEQARQALTAAIERMLSLSVQVGVQRVVSYLPKLRDDVDRQLKVLYKLLIEPLLAWIPPAAPLLVAPDHTLYYIPFHALHDGARYLIEERAVSYAPSATLLDACTRAQAAGSGALFCGYADDRLAAVAAELQVLKPLFPQAQWLLQAQTTTDAFLSQAPHSRLLHIAAHATFRTDRPMLSSITLADRRLTLAEITRQSLHADLVVLSGCETGHGQLRGADLISLATGFLGAGARSLVVSLWRVEDEATAHLMAYFYQALLDGQNRAEALRTAQLALLHRGRSATDREQLFTHPAYWAPFMLIGHWQSTLI